MEPRNQLPSHESEPIAKTEYAGGALTGSEQYGVRSPEQSTERSPELSAVRSQAENAATAMPTITLPTPVVTNTEPTATASSTPAPSVANDDDLIEKEWVDKAKQIIQSTKDDPYTREREIAKLQIEYIKKRYGRVIGDVGN